MINYTSYGVHNAGQLFATNTVSLKTICHNLINTRRSRLLFAAFLLLLCGPSNKSFAFGTTYYYPTSATAGAGGTYCVGSSAAGITGTIADGSGTAIGGASSTVTWKWYYNTTGATGTLTGATLVYTGTSYTAGAAAAAANLPAASISTSTIGTYYYFMRVHYTGGTAPAATLFSNLATVNVLPANVVTGPTTVCTGNTIALTDASTGGIWSSSNPAVGSVSAGGIVSALTAGTTTISYTNACGPALLDVTVLQSPDAITGPNNVCADSATIIMSDDSTGGVWTSSNLPVATAVTASTTTGLVTGLTGGTALISYTWFGCTVSTQITVTSLPAAIAGSLKQCTATSVTLSDSLAGGRWTSFTVPVASVDSITGVVTGAAAGTTTITYTTSCGFVTAVDTTVGIPNPIQGKDSTCVGSNIVFADVVLGGTWSSSATGIATVLPNSGIITGVSAGTAMITYTVPPGCYNTHIVTINPLPSAILGSLTTLCPGTTITLSDALAGGTWSSLRSFVASAAPTSGVITGVSADTATIVYTSNLGCTANTVVTVNPAPLPITGGITTCGLSTDTVYDATPGGVWSNSPATIATIGATTGIVTTISGGTTVITYKLAATTGCYATKVLTVTPAPVPGVYYSIATNSFYTDTFYVSYQWYDSLQGLIPGAISARTAALYNGNYWVVVTDSNGCVGASIPYHYNAVSMVGVHNVANDDIRIYPNPASNVVFVESSIKVRAVITGIDGKTEMEQADARQMNIGSLANGMYFISLYNDNGERLMVQKLIKQ